MRPNLLAPLLSLTCFALTTAACGGAAEAMAPASPRAVMDSAVAEASSPGAPPPPMAQAMPSSSASYPRQASQAKSAGAPAPAPAPRGGKAESTAAEASQPPLIIYAGELQMAEDEARFAATLDHAIDVAESVGGYMAARKDASVQVRVPSARFREALTKMEAMGAVVHRSVSASDVSEEVHDSEVRLQNLRATRARLQDLLAKAPNVSDTLIVERELERVAQEIDHLEGRLQFLKSRAAFSQIDVTLVAIAKPAHVIEQEKPGRHYVELPVSWLDTLGLPRLLTVR